MKRNYYSVIDIGSNTMRLVIYTQAKSGRLHEVENVKSVARLRNYLTEDNCLSEEGKHIMISTLRSFKEVVDTYPIAELKCVGTAAVRQAKNRDDIQRLVKEQIGWEIRILSEKEEAYYGYLSVVNSTSITEGVTIDIGGGSTEVTYFKDRLLVESHSFPFGALTLKSYFTEPKQNVKAINELNHFLTEQFQSLDWLQNRKVPLIGIGGSARNMAQIDQNIKNYPLAGLHQYEMNDSDIAKIVTHLASLSRENLEKVEGLSSDRADTILPASVVFYSLYQVVNASSFVLSRKGLRDGIFYQELTRNYDNHLYPNVLEVSIREMVYEYNLDPQQINHVQFLTKKMFNGFKDKGIGSLTQQDWINLERACFVFNLGEYIDSESSAQHTFYLIANRTIDGLMHMDRLKLALIASFKNKTVFKQFIEPYKSWFLKKERKKLQLLGAMLKFTYCLDATKRQVAQDMEISIKDEHTVKLTIWCDKDFKPEEYQAMKQKKHLEKALDKNLELQFKLQG